jgi:hypothetical protein
MENSQTTDQILFWFALNGWTVGFEPYLQHFLHDPHYTRVYISNGGKYYYEIIDVLSLQNNPAEVLSVMRFLQAWARAHGTNYQKLSDKQFTPDYARTESIVRMNKQTQSPD